MRILPFLKNFITEKGEININNLSILSIQKIILLVI